MANDKIRQNPHPDPARWKTLMRWFRWHRGTVSNPDFAMISAEASKPSDVGEGDRCYGTVTVTDAIAVWAVTLECAASDEHWGVCTKDAKFIAIVLRWWPDEVQSVLDCFQKYNMVERVDDGYRIVNWDKYQYVSDRDPTNAERQKRYRERKRKSNKPVTDKKRTRNALPKRPDSETDSETERENNNGKDDEFEFWYQHYPKKAARGAAERAFKTALKRTDLQTLVATTVSYAEQVAGKDPQFIKAPATWLNGKCWLDEDTDSNAALWASIESEIAEREQ